MNESMRTAVCFPSPETLARSFDTELLAEIGAAAAEQCIEDRTDICPVPVLFCADEAQNRLFRDAYARGIHSRGVSAQGDAAVLPLPPRDPDFFLGAAHHLARKAARESAVLLKNEGLLPLKSKGAIALIGEPAMNPRICAGEPCAEPFDVDPALMSVRSVAKAEYAKGFSRDAETTDEEALKQARDLASRSDVCIIFAETAQDRLPAPQERAIIELSNVCKHIAVVLHCGSAVHMPWLDAVSAVLLLGRGGEACGAAAVDILFGGVSPSGRLTSPFPPFEAKHGLSYCPLKIAAGTDASCVQVENEGHMGTKTVVFSPNAKENAVFEKIYLSPHETKTVYF